MLRAKKYLGSVGIGVTAPCLVEGEDGGAYVVKLKNNRLGTKVLVNEYIAARFAALAALCFPAGGPMELTEAFIGRTSRLRRARVAAGLHFASRYIEKAKYVHHRHLPFIQNKGQIAGVMLFDHLLLNDDRTLNGKNMLIQRAAEGYRFYAIDNSHLFGSGRWRTDRLEALSDRVRVNKRRAYGTLLRHYLSAADFAPYAAKFQAITKEQFAEIVDSVPREWLDDETARQALKDFLIKRFARIDLIVAKIIEEIPQASPKVEV